MLHLFSSITIRVHLRMVISLKGHIGHSAEPEQLKHPFGFGGIGRVFALHTAIWIARTCSSLTVRCAMVSLKPKLVFARRMHMCT